MSLIRRSVNRLLSQLGTLLILFGIGLVAVGGSVQLARIWRLARAESQDAAPSFAGTIRVAPAVPTAAPSPTPPGAPTATAGPSATPSPAPRPDRIVIPSIKLDRRVVEIGWTTELVDNDTLRREWETAAHAAGFHRDTAPPGTAGNTVVSGHNNIDGAVFRDLHRLAPGDRVQLYAGGRRFGYRVERSFIVREEGATPEQRAANGLWIGDTPDERLTLVTCYPPWGNSHRVIVIARPAPDDGAPDGEGEAVR